MRKNGESDESFKKRFTTERSRQYYVLQSKDLTISLRSLPSFALHIPTAHNFTRLRRFLQGTVKKSNTSTLTIDDLGLPTAATIDRIAIYSHLTPKLQELLHAAKDHQKLFNYKWCWAKGAAVYLRKTETSASLRLRSTNDLGNLRARESYLSGRESSPSGHQSSDG